MTFSDKLVQFTFAYDRVFKLQSGKFNLLWMAGSLQAFKYPVIQWTMIFEFQGTQGMGNSFNSIGNTVGIIVHGIKTPVSTGAMMMATPDSVQCGVTHVDIG